MFQSLIIGIPYFIHYFLFCFLPIFLEERGFPLRPLAASPSLYPPSKISRPSNSNSKSIPSGNIHSPLLPPGATLIQIPNPNVSMLSIVHPNVSPIICSFLLLQMGKNGNGWELEMPIHKQYDNTQKISRKKVKDEGSKNAF
jgi:hypothetical protein